MDSVNEFLYRISECSKLSSNNQALQLASFLSLNPQVNPYIIKFNSLPLITDEELNELVDSKYLYNDEWLAFKSLVVSFIKLSNQLNAWSVLESFDLYTQFINDLSIAFNNTSRGQLLSYLVKNTINIILPLAIKLDYQLYYKENCLKPRLTYLASILLKIFNNIRSQLGDQDNKSLKRSIILFVGVRLCSIYFKLSNPLLCRNIFSNMNNANLSFKSFDVNEQIQYRYYLGRFYLIKNQFIDSYQHLLWCLFKCPVLKDNENITRILKYLLPISIIIGKRPNFSYLKGLYYTSAPEFFEIYSDLLNAIKLGNFNQFNAVINKNYKFLKDSNLLLLLVTKSKLILLRNLIKKTWLINGKSLKLEYDTIKLGLSLALNPVDINFNSFVININDDSTIENLLISLVDQNLLRGKIFSRLRAIALSKTNVFAKIDTINFTRFGNGLEGTLNTNDRWMDD